MAAAAASVAVAFTALVAQAEATGVGTIASFDRSIDRVANISRREP
jgi:hypothetical protein